MIPSPISNTDMETRSARSVDILLHVNSLVAKERVSEINYVPVLHQRASDLPKFLIVHLAYDFMKILISILMVRFMSDMMRIFLWFVLHPKQI